MSYGADRGWIGAKHEAPASDRTMAVIVVVIVSVAFVWFFFLGGAVQNSQLTVSGDDISNQNQVQHEIHDDAPGDSHS